MHAKDILDTFSLASGLTIHWGKSEARWIAPFPRPEETDALNWAWKETDSPGQLLGYSFINGLEDNSIFTSLVDKLKRKLQRWNRFQVSLHGKIIIANHRSRSLLALVCADTSGFGLQKVTTAPTNASFVCVGENRQANSSQGFTTHHYLA